MSTQKPRSLLRIEYEEEVRRLCAEWERLRGTN